MALELRQQLKLAQQLVMTPQLQQAIKLLQLSRLELLETVQQELLENPFLEETSAVSEESPAADHAREFRDKLVDLLFFMLPLMEAEGRYRITVALGCTGGRHRSVAMAEEILQALRQADYPAFLEHRHLELG